MIIGLAYVLRPDVVLYIVVLAFCLVVSGNHEGRFKESLFHIVQLLVGCFGVVFISSTLIKSTGINPIGLKLNNDVWKFVVGLNLESRGKWASDLADCLEQGLITKEYLWKEISNLSLFQIVRLFNDKVKIFWAGNANMWSIGHWANETLRNFVYNIDSNYWGIVLLLGGIGNIKILIRERFLNIYRAFFPIGVVFVSITYAIIEVQERYRYAFMILLIIPMAYIYKNLENILCQDAVQIMLNKKE